MWWKSEMKQFFLMWFCTDYLNTFVGLYSTQNIGPMEDVTGPM